MLAAEALERRALLAVTAGIVGGDLLISYDTGDLIAEIASDGTKYTVSGTGLSATQFPIASVTGRIGVTDAAATGGQTFRVLAGTALANPLQVDSAVESTDLVGGIATSVAGDVLIGSPSITLSANVSTAATNGTIVLSGAVALGYDAACTSGSGTITIGSVTAPAGVLLTLGNTQQTGAARITGNVSLPYGYITTAGAAFDVALEGADNVIAHPSFNNTGNLRIGRAGGTTTFNSEGLVATAPANVSLAGVVETVGSPLTIGNTTLLADATLRSGSGPITTGAVTDGDAAFALSLGSLTQTGEIVLGGSVTLDGLTTAAGNFSVSLRGSSNEITKQVAFTNTSYVSLGSDTQDVSRFAGGVTATSQTAANFLIGTVRTAGAPIDIAGGYLTGLTTLDTSDLGGSAGGAPIVLRNGVRLEGHVLTTIGGVGASAQGTYLYGTGQFGSGATDDGSLIVQAGSLAIGDGIATAALTVADDTTIQVTAGSVSVGAGSTIDAAGAVLTLLADDIVIASTTGSIDALRVTLAPVTSGRNVFLAASGTGLVLDLPEIQALDTDTLVIGTSGYAGRVTVGSLTLTDTTLAIVADGTGGGATFDGPFTSTGTPASGFGLEVTGSGAGTLINGTITSTGDVVIGDAVELGATTVTIDTSATGADVTITGGTAGIWSTDGESNSLVVTTGTGSTSLAGQTGFGDNGGAASLVRNVTVTGGAVNLGGGNVIAGDLSIGSPQVRLATVVRAGGAIGIDDGAGADTSIVIGGNTVLDTTREGENPAGNPVTLRGTVTAVVAANYLFNVKAGTGGDVLVTGRIGVVGTGAALGSVTISGNDLTVAAIDGLTEGLFLEAVDGVDPGSVTLTGTTYSSTTALGISAGSRDPVTNALGSPENRITLAGGAAGSITSVVTAGSGIELAGDIDLAGRNLTIDATDGGSVAAGSYIYVYDAVDGAGTLTLDAGTAGDVVVNHLSGMTGATTPLTGVTLANAQQASFARDMRAGTVRIVDATGEVVFAGVLDISVGFVTEAEPYGVKMLSGGAGSSRIAGTTTFENTGRVVFGDAGPPDVINFVGGIVATAPSEVRLAASLLADTGSIVLGDVDSDVTVLGATVGGAAAAITLGDVVLQANGGLILGTGLASTVRVGSVTGTVDGFADAITIDTTGTATITGSVGSGVDRITVTKSGGTTFEAAVAAGTVTLTDTTGSIAFGGDLTADRLETAANGYSVAFQGAVTTVTTETWFLNTGAVSFGDQSDDVTTFDLGLSTSAGPSGTSVAGTLASSGNLSLGSVTLTAPNVVLRGVDGTFGVIAGTTSDLELDFAGRVTLPQAKAPGVVLARALRASDGVLSGSGAVGNLALTSAATLQVSATGIQPGSGYGQFTVANLGTIDLGSAALSLAGSTPLPMGSILKLIDNGGSNPVTGTFAGLPEGALMDSPAGVCRVSYTGGDGNDVTLEVVSRDTVVSIEDERLFVRLAGSGTTIRNLSTQYLPASRRLVVTMAADKPLTGGGTGLTVNSRAGTVTVDLAQLPMFGGVVLVGTGATDRITVGPRGINLAALKGGSASQALAIVTADGPDVVTVRSPVRTRGDAGGCVIQANMVNLGTSIDTQLGQQRYRGHVMLVGTTSLSGGTIEFDGAMDGGHRLGINATGGVVLGAVGGMTALKGITIQRAASVESFLGMRLDGRGLGPAANGLVIGRGVRNLTIYSDDPTASPCTINGFGGSGILFQGGSQNSTIRTVNLAGNGQGITLKDGDYTGTVVAANTILRSKRAGIMLDGARNATIGADDPRDGNLIQGGSVPRLSGSGVVAKCLLTGTRLICNTIKLNNGGIVMQNARGIAVGGAGRDNTVTGNVAWGLVAVGNSTGSVVDTSGISGNTPGDVNVRRARGLVVVPAG